MIILIFTKEMLIHLAAGGRNPGNFGFLTKAVLIHLAAGAKILTAGRPTEVHLCLSQTWNPEYVLCEAMKCKSLPAGFGSLYSGVYYSENRS